MLKRQDARRPRQPLVAAILTGLLLLLTPACQPLPTPPAVTPSPTASEQPNRPTQTLTQAVMPTRSPSASPTAVSTSTPSPTPDCRQSGGTLQEEIFFSDLLEKEFRATIYLPPCYANDSQDGFPVLYLLHGQTFSNDQWLRLGLVRHMEALISQGEITPFIIVLPLEAPAKPPQVSEFPDVLLGELIPRIDDQYATRPEKAFRAIGGLSRGAGWAVQIGFENPDLFCCIGAHSLPLFKADGGKITRWLTQTPIEALPRIFIDIGRSDQEWQSAQRFANQLDAAHIPHEWYLFSNGHTEDYWSSHLDLYLNWYAKSW